MSPPYKLTYFDIMGLAEPIRLLLSYGNLEFEDCRVPRESWPNIKASKYRFTNWCKKVSLKVDFQNTE